jgi:competence protein ComEC
MTSKNEPLPDQGRPPDLRLSGFAVSIWLTSLAALYLSAPHSLLLGIVTLIAACLLATAGARLRKPTYRWIAVAMLAGAACGALSTAARVHTRDAEPLASLTAAGTTVRADFTVTDDPRALDSAPGLPPTHLVAVTLHQIAGPDHPPIRLKAKALLLASGPEWRTLLPGQRAQATGRLAQPRGGDLTAAVVSVHESPVLQGQPSWVQRAAGALRAGLQRACEPLPDDVGGLLPGLVVGDTSRMDQSVEDNFRIAGLTHLTAVSGANVAILLGVVLAVLRWTRAGAVVIAAVCALTLIGFVILARPSPSVVRAAAMGAIGLLGLAMGRPGAALPALSAGAAVLLLADPELSADPGFALSVLATGGLLLLAPPWRDALQRRGWPTWAAEALAVPAAAQVACGPVVAALSSTVSLVAVPANLLAVPAITPATLLGVAAALLSPLLPPAAEFAAWAGQWPARWLVLIASHGANLPAGALPWPGGVTGGLLLALLTVALLTASRRPVVRKLVAVVAVSAVLGALPVRVIAPGWPPPDWLMVACAVGQGDAVVLPAGRNRAVVVDAGPDAQAVDLCLRRLSVREIALLVISHFHVDHIGGLSGVLRSRPVAAIVTPDWPDPPAGRAAVLTEAARTHTPTAAVAPGWRYTVAGLTLTVLGPRTRLSGTNSDPNNNSLVLTATLHNRTLLLTGDAETEEQDDLLAHLGPAAVHADVLKVAHHGSAYQSPAFLEAVDPALALVSVGLDNDYGHPNAALLAALTRSGARVLRTDQNGDLAATLTPTGLAAAARGDPPPP